MTKLQHAIVFVSDMKAAIEFYRDVLGFCLRFESPEWTEFDTGEVTLALHVTVKGGTEPPATGSPPGRCQLGLGVEDIEAFHRHLTARGVACLQPPRQEDFGGKLAKYVGPDGLPFSVTEFRDSKH